MGPSLTQKNWAQPLSGKLLGWRATIPIVVRLFFPARSLFLPKKKNFFSTFCERRRRDRGRPSAHFPSLSGSELYFLLSISIPCPPKKSRVVPFLVHCSKLHTLLLLEYILLLSSEDKIRGTKRDGFFFIWGEQRRKNARISTLSFSLSPK